MSPQFSDSALEEQLKALASEVEERLRSALDLAEPGPAKLKEAMGHALLGGGKRLRPALVIRPP